MWLLLRVGSLGVAQSVINFIFVCASFSPQRRFLLIEIAASAEGYHYYGGSRHLCNLLTTRKAKRLRIFYVTTRG